MSAVLRPTVTSVLAPDPEGPSGSAFRRGETSTPTNMENLMMGILAVLLLGYLMYAMLRPEKF